MPAGSPGAVYCVQASPSQYRRPPEPSSYHPAGAFVGSLMLSMVAESAHRRTGLARAGSRAAGAKFGRVGAYVRCERVDALASDVRGCPARRIRICTDNRPHSIRPHDGPAAPWSPV